MKPLLSKHQLINKAYNPEDFRELGHQLIDLLANHLEDVQSSSEKPVLSYQDPKKELQFWQQHFNDNTDTKNLFKTIIEHSIHIQNPRYMGHQTATVAPIASLAGLLSDFLNNGTGVYEMGPASNALEKLVTDIMAKYIGYETSASGILTSGGTLANLTALLAARKAKGHHDIWQKGYQKNKLAVIVSAESHYCIDRAARIMGFGDDGIISVPVDEHYKIDTSLLEQYYEEAISNGLEVIAVVGCACSTATGSYDDLDFLANFSKKHNLWFHVDGAHGGAAIFSNKYKNLVKGIQKADSVVIDFHKMLMTPALTTALMFKEGKDVYKTFAQKAEYLWDTPDTEEWFNSGKRTFECTKLMMSIKVYSIIKSYGIEIFEQNVNQLYDAAKDFSELIKEDPNFELLVVPESNIVNFRYSNPKTSIDINMVNTKIRQQLIEFGHFYIVQTSVKNQKYLRCTIMNPLTNKHHFKALLEEVKSIGSSLHN
ncbi:MAG: aminotransferase class I/II-fold pyridoxal phosphate-dependent enzyme [Flavobacteriaceae bacterium]